MWGPSVPSGRQLSDDRSLDDPRGRTLMESPQNEVRFWQRSSRPHGFGLINEQGTAFDCPLHRLVRVPKSPGFRTGLHRHSSPTLVSSLVRVYCRKVRRYRTRRPPTEISLKALWASSPDWNVFSLIPRLSLPHVSGSWRIESCGFAPSVTSPATALSG